jgi:hypothetical protein
MATNAESLIPLGDELSAHMQRLSTVLSNFAHPDEEFDIKTEGDVKASFDDLTEKAAHIQQEFHDFESETSSSFEAARDAITSATESVTARLEQKFESILASLEQTHHEVEAASDHHKNVLGSVSIALQEHQAGAGEKSTKVMSAIAATASELQNGLSQNLQQEFDNLLSALQGWDANVFAPSAQHLAQLAPRVQTLLDNGFNGLIKTSEAEFGSLEQIIDNGIAQITQTIGSSTQKSMPNLQQSLVDHASQALANEITEGVAMATVGGQVSTALAPHLSYLLAIKAALDGLREAITIWKKLKNPLGELG